MYERHAASAVPPAYKAQMFFVTPLAAIDQERFFSDA
jgi:hypothetical protein